jgi:alanine dehydrogenase
VIHYCVANMPGAVGRTSTQALCHATQPYVMKLASSKRSELFRNDESFASALNISDGRIVHPAVAAAYAERRQPAAGPGCLRVLR